MQKQLPTTSKEFLIYQQEPPPFIREDARDGAASKERAHSHKNTPHARTLQRGERKGARATDRVAAGAGAAFAAHT